MCPSLSDNGQPPPRHSRSAPRVRSEQCAKSRNRSGTGYLLRAPARRSPTWIGRGLTSPRAPLRGRSVAPSAAHAPFLSVGPAIVDASWRGASRVEQQPCQDVAAVIERHPSPLKVTSHLMSDSHLVVPERISTIFATCRPVANHCWSSAAWTPVCPKSLPFRSSGSRRSIAGALERQSPKFKPAGWPLTLPKSA